MASEWATYQRLSAAADMRRTVRPFFMQPTGYLNRHTRRAIAAAKRRGAKPRSVVAAARAQELAAHSNEQRAAMIESEAPT